MDIFFMRERNRLVRKGFIVPAATGRPTPLVKRPDGSWTTVVDHTPQPVSL